MSARPEPRESRFRIVEIPGGRRPPLRVHSFRSWRGIPGQGLTTRSNCAVSAYCWNLTTFPFDSVQTWTN